MTNKPAADLCPMQPGRSRPRSLLFAGALALTLAGAGRVLADESGSGHYMPGASASFIDSLPGREGLIYMNAYTWYGGTASKSREIEYGGQLALNARGTVNADTSILLYETPWKVAGADYALGLAVPYIWMDISAKVQAGATTVKKEDRNEGLGDAELFPFMLVWKMGDVKIGTQLGVYAPTGEYDKDRMANLGKNYWTFEPGVNVSWLSSKTGLELSGFGGADFNTTNNATDYKSGDSIHLEGTVAQHLPLGNGFAGVGITGFLYQQITADTGDGAVLGDFRGRTLGVGPTISYATKIGKTDVAAELKWLPDMDVQKRLTGDTIWFKLAFVF